MLVLLSPAKSLDWSPVATELDQSQPVLGSDMGILMRVMKRKTPQELSALMHISDKLAHLNRDRFEAMSGAPEPTLARPAALAFNGDVYQGLSARTLSHDDLAWAQDHVAILSGLYGVLRPLDAIEPYRLEMGTRLKTRRGTNLYSFWGDRVTRVLNRRLQDHPSPVVVNLASNEYAKVVQKKQLKANVITPVFLEATGDTAKTISFFAKRARGMMTRFIVEGRLTDPADLEGFTAGSYRFSPERSTADKPVFIRPKPPPAR
ncbi:MAG: hypothetical protein CL927_14720 [Deltaproteobacteria bacterium]|nr:hypothetical protein [Deltaproteobacteria bacterium]HCH65971.1 peroxide stress protein YaaA [Deltaproteobacteria bacterium]